MPMRPLLPLRLKTEKKNSVCFSFYQVNFKNDDFFNERTTEREKK